MMKEFWLPIAGYEGCYAVSDAGRVRSLERRVPRKGRGLLSIPARILQPGIAPIGYPLVFLRKDGIGRSAFVHRLVADAFLPANEALRDIDHANGDRLDNRLENLRRASRSQNNGNRAKHKGKSAFKGVSPHQGKFIAQIKCGDRHVRKSGFASEVEAARAYDKLAVEIFGPFARTNFPQTEGTAP